jgi:hypothetical protein
LLPGQVRPALQHAPTGFLQDRLVAVTGQPMSLIRQSDVFSAFSNHGI